MLFLLLFFLGFFGLFVVGFVKAKPREFHWFKETLWPRRLPGGGDMEIVALVVVVVVVVDAVVVAVVVVIIIVENSKILVLVLVQCDFLHCTMG